MLTEIVEFMCKSLLFCHFGLWSFIRANRCSEVALISTLDLKKYITVSIIYTFKLIFLISFDTQNGAAVVRPVPSQ